MFGFLSSRRHWPIALDIGAESIRMLQLCDLSGGVKVRAAGRWRFPADAGSDPARRKELAVGAIRDILSNNAFNGRRVVSMLSSSQLSLKNVRLPHMPPDELEQAVAWEAKDRFSFDVGPDQLSFLYAGQVRQGNEIQDEIIMLAAPIEAVDENLDLLKKAGLSHEAIDAEPVALFRTFKRFLRRRSDEVTVSVIVDVGESGSRVIVARGRDIVFIKNINIGGRRLTEVVAKQLDLSFEEARELRIRNASHRDDPSSVDWTIHDAIRGEVEALGMEIALCLRYCSVTFRGLRPQRVILTGGETHSKPVVDLLKENVGIACEIGQPLKGIDTSEVDLGADRRGTAPEWALCMGLAIRGMNIGITEQEGDDEQRRLSA